MKRPDPDVRLQHLGPSTWRVSVPGVYLTVAESRLERDLALTVASDMARRARCGRYARAYPETMEDRR